MGVDLQELVEYGCQKFSYLVEKGLTIHIEMEKLGVFTIWSHINLSNFSIF